MDTNLEKSGNEEIESVHTLTYTSIINVDEILKNWVEEWNETLDKCGSKNTYTPNGFSCEGVGTYG